MPAFAPLVDAVGAKVRSDPTIRDIAFASLLRSGPGFDSLFLQGNRTMVVPVEPQKLTERLSIQQGTFLAAGNANTSFMDNLLAMDGWNRGYVRKFMLPFAERGRALENLRLMNITRASLFPGLDGFAQSFRQLLVREPRERRAIRLALEDGRSIQNRLTEPDGPEPQG